MESNKIIYIRTDGNETIASGHIMRCLSIAYELVKQKVSVTFIVADKSSASFLKKQIILFSQSSSNPDFLAVLDMIICLNSTWDQLSTEVPLMQQLLDTNKPDYLLVDSYYVTKDYFQFLNPFTKIVYLDDLMSFDYPVDTIINYDLSVDASFYQSATTLLLGGAYAPLREEFRDFTYHVKEQVSHILLSTGGSDEHGLAVSILNGFITQSKDHSVSFNDYTFHVVLGSLSKQKSALYQLADAYPNIIIEENVTHMKDLMEQCDLAITAGGTTLYELCSIGIPCVCYAITDNQYLCIRYFVDQLLVRYAGDFHHNKQLVSDIVIQSFSYIHDEFSRLLASNKMHSVIDGRGCERIATALIK